MQTCFAPSRVQSVTVRRDSVVFCVKLETWIVVRAVDLITNSQSCVVQEESESPLHRIEEEDDGCAIVLTKRNRSQEPEFSCRLLSRTTGQRTTSTSTTPDNPKTMFAPNLEKAKNTRPASAYSIDVENFDRGQSLSVISNIDRSLYPARIDLHGRTTPNKNCSFYFQNSRVPLTKCNTHTLGKYAEKVQGVNADVSGLLM